MTSLLLPPSISKPAPTLLKVTSEKFSVSLPPVPAIFEPDMPSPSTVSTSLSKPFRPTTVLAAVMTIVSVPPSPETVSEPLLLPE